MLTKCPNCNHKFEPDTLHFDPDDPIVKSVKKHMDACDIKFKADNPCPKCGSHNVDIDLGTPMWCVDCGWEW
jgi:Zn finger protein HypA/HybF involved in hydrogenase expression